MKNNKSVFALIISFVLIFAFVFGCFSANAETKALENTGEEKTTNRYYFYQPEIWKNKYSDKVGIYWWDTDEPCPSWPGVEAHKSDIEGVYYYDVPIEAGYIIWTNLVDGGLDPEAEIYNYAERTGNICAEFYFPDEIEVYPNGIESFDGMIYVVNFINYSSSYWKKTSYNGEWYYYYGNGEYGLTPEKSEIIYSNSYLMEPLEIGEFTILDINADGNINIKDATAVQKYCAKLIDFDEGQLKRADGWRYDSDTGENFVNVTIRTATRIQKFSAHLLNNSSIYGY